MYKILLTSALFMLMCQFSAAKDLAPPEHILVDQFGVNLATGQVTTSVNTVAIGGELGLSHKAATHDSGFVTDYNGFYKLGGIPSTGFYETYDGNAIYKRLTEQSQRSITVDGTTIPMEYLSALQIFDKDGSENFLVKLNGILKTSISCSPSCPAMSGITFVPMKDNRNSLAWDGANLIWQKASGAKSYFPVQSGLHPLYGGRFRLTKIVYANGFTIALNRPENANSLFSVTTNTGFQFKYYYKQNLSGLDPEKASSNVNVAMNTNPVSNTPTIDSNTWSSRNPYQIVAINNAIDPCKDLSDTDVFGNTCPAMELSIGSYKKWPRATFFWPNGMPRALYIGDSSVAIVDSQNRRTEYGLRAFNVTNINHPSAPLMTPNLAAQDPRIISVKSASTAATQKTLTYKYSVLSGTTQLVDGGSATNADGVPGAAILSLNKFSVDWCRDPSCTVKDTKSYSDGQYKVLVRTESGIFGNKMLSTTLNGTMHYEYLDAQNTPYKYVPVTGPTQNFYYDSRGNLNRIIYNEDKASQTEVNSFFPASCSNPKTCNKPEWTSDAKGNKTYFTYHPQSGEVASIKSPAMLVNGQSIEPVTRFKYAQLYANYYRNGAVNKSQAETPVWLKTTEKTCMKTATNIDADVCAGGANDEVVTNYEYNDNLLLRGTTVTALNATGVMETRRTCYQYDIYGNRIGETQPMAGLNSCNQ